MASTPLSRIIGGAAITATGGSASVDLGVWSRASINVVNGATNAVTFTVEGSLDNANFVTVAYGQGSNAAYTQAALTVAGSGKAVLFLPRDDYFRWIRVNPSVANANGTTFTAYYEQAPV